MINPINSTGIQSRMLESMASLIVETLDVPIVLIFSKGNSSRKLLFNSGIIPTGIPPAEIWEADASAHSKKVVFFEDLSRSKRDTYSFDSLLSQGIRFCSRVQLVSDQHRNLGELFLMDYSTHKLTHTTIHNLESIADLASQILERIDVDRQSANKLKKSREFNQIVHEATLHSGSGGLSLNLESKTVFWFKSNNAALDLPRSFKLTYADLVRETQTFDSILYPQLLEFIEQVRLGISRMKTSTAEGTFVFGKEKKKYFTYSLHKVREVIYLVFKDNTKQVEMSKELWDVQTLLQAEESYLLTGGWTLNLQNQKMSWTDNIRRILNLNEEITPSWELFVEKLKFSDSYRPSDIIAICMEPPGRFNNEADVLLDSGIKKHVLLQADLSQGPDGEKHLLGFLHDTTESKLNKKDFGNLLSNLWKKEAYIDKLLLNETFFLMKTSLDGTFKSVNKLYSDLFFGPGPHAIENYNPMKFIAIEDHGNCLEGAEKALKNPGCNVKVYLRKYTWEKKEIFTRWDFKVLVDENNLPSEILCIGIDITEVEEKKRELRELMDLVSKQNTQLIEYNSILSHNIRNHVANLKGLSNLIELTNDPKDIIHYFGLIKEAIGNLDQRITSFNYLNKPKIEGDKENIPLSSIIANCKAFFEEELNLIEAEFYTIGDSDLLNTPFNSILERILIQLISNCIKFRSPKRGLIIQIKVLKKAGNFKISVQDNGIGMDPKKNNVNTYNSMEIKNLEPNSRGLGIFIARNLTESLGGNLKFISKKDLGTRINLTIGHVW